MSELAVTSRGPDDAVASSSGFLATAVKRFHRCDTAEASNRAMAVEDLKFKAGDQWPESIKSQRTIDKRPCLTINKMKTFVHQITNDQRQNRPAISVSPVGDRSDIETAKMLKGLIRQIERQSNADIAYDTAFDSAVSMGWGYWRIVTAYDSHDSFDQSLRIERIRNPFRVYMDPDHQEPDGSDAQWCFISDVITREEFKEQFPKATLNEWLEQGLGDEDKLWETQSHVRIADYYYYESTKRELLYLANGHVGFRDELAPELAEMIKDESMIKDSRDVSVKKVKWCKITAHQVLEETDWLGESIPVVKVIGDESDVEGKVTYAGLVRDAKDPQRMYNFWCTSETELIALAPKAPWIIEEGQIEGYEKDWKEANVKSKPYLTYKGSNIAGKPAPPPQRQQFAGPPQGVVNAKIGAAQDMQAVTGIRFDATQQERMYDESGKALRELKRVGDLGNFHYVDNLGRALRYTGRQFVDLIPKYYDTRRVLTILREDDSEETAIIDPNQATPYQKTQDPSGKVQRIYNPKVGKYGVAITIGPSFATKRAEAADSMLQFMKVVPQSAPLISDLIAKNMDWPGAQEIAARLETTLPPAMQEKAMEDLPQEARGVVMNLKQQLQQAQEQLKHAAAMLGDKEADRKLQQDKIDKDFEAKMKTLQVSLQETILKLQADGQAGNEAAMTKVMLDHQVKVKEMLIEFKLEIMKLEQERHIKERELAAEMTVRSAELDQAKQFHDDDIGLQAATTDATLSQTERLEREKLKSGERVATSKIKSGEKVATQKVKSGVKK